MRWLHGQSGRKSTDYALRVVLCVGGLRAWPIDRCSNKDAGKRERETLTLCATVRHKDRKGERTTERGDQNTPQNEIIQPKAKQNSTQHEVILLSKVCRHAEFGCSKNVCSSKVWFFEARLFRGSSQAEAWHVVLVVLFLLSIEFRSERGAKSCFRLGYMLTVAFLVL